MKALAVAAFLFASSLAPTQPADDGRFRPAAADGVKDAYTVVLATTKPDEVDATVQRLLQTYPGTLEYVYRTVLRGFSVSMPEATAKAMSQDPAVTYVEQQVEIHFTDEQLDPPWNLDRLDRRGTLDDLYRLQTTGAGAHAYVIDTGIRQSHVDFEVGPAGTSPSSRSGSTPGAPTTATAVTTSSRSAVAASATSTSRSRWAPGSRPPRCGGGAS